MLEAWHCNRAISVSARESLITRAREPNRVYHRRREPQCPQQAWKSLPRRPSVHPSVGCLPGAGVEKGWPSPGGQGRKGLGRTILRAVGYHSYHYWPARALLSVFTSQNAGLNSPPQAPDVTQGSNKFPAPGRAGGSNALTHTVYSPPQQGQHAIEKALPQCNSCDLQTAITDKELGIKSFLSFCWKSSLYTRKIWNTSLHTHTQTSASPIFKIYLQECSQRFSHTLNQHL